MKKKRQISLSSKIIIMVAVVLLVSTAALTAVSVTANRISIRNSIHQRMLDISNCAAASVDGDVLRTLTPADKGNAKYLNIYNALAVFRDNVELEYIYAIKADGDGKFIFTIDTDLKTPADYGDEVEYTEALERASKGIASVDEIPYTDAWGSFYSAYSPVFDIYGNVTGIIAADFSVDWFNDQLAEQTRTTVWNHLLILLATIVLSAVLTFLIVRPFIKKQAQLTLEVEKREKENQELFVEVVQSLADAIDAKDTYTNGHSGRVATYSREIARRYGYTDEQLDEIYMIGLLHDVGKIGVPDYVINKTSSLTEEEFNMIKKHSTMGEKILKNITSMPGLAVGAKSHHEKFGGGGYPDGLSGSDIPEVGRIIAVADAYDAMTSNRSYRNALPQSMVRDQIAKGRGTQFDPVFANIMLTMIDEDPGYQMREARNTTLPKHA